MDDGKAGILIPSGRVDLWINALNQIINSSAKRDYYIEKSIVGIIFITKGVVLTKNLLFGVIFITKGVCLTKNRIFGVTFITKVVFLIEK